jgi:hypothetical protein
MKNKKTIGDFIFSIHDNNVKEIKKLLKNKNIDPAHEYNYAVQITSQLGNIEMIKLLLNDPRVDPSDSQHSALRLAISHDNDELAKLLIKHPKFDFTMSENIAIEYAFNFKKYELVTLLWNNENVKKTLATQHPKLHSILTKMYIQKKINEFNYE